MIETSTINPADLPEASPVHSADPKLIARLGRLTDGLNMLAQEARANSVAHGFGAHGVRLRADIARLERELLEPLTKSERADIQSDLSEAQEDYGAYVGNRLMLIQSEGVEAFEEVRSGHAPTETYYRADGKPEGVGAELADILIRVFDTAIELDIDLETRVVEKMAHNAGRPAMHGRKF